MVGTGYVGLVSGLCFAEFGYETVCIDKNQSRLNSIIAGKSPFFILASFTGCLLSIW